MKIRLKTTIFGHRNDENFSTRIHAERDDILPVIFQNPTHYLCASLKYPEQPIVVFKSQCEVVERIKESVIEDPHEAEKYYHVYTEPSDPNLNDPFNTAFEFED
jgi:hypothetical protein